MNHRHASTLMKTFFLIPFSIFFFQIYCDVRCKNKILSSPEFYRFFVIEIFPLIFSFIVKCLLHVKEEAAFFNLRTQARTLTHMQRIHKLLSGRRKCLSFSPDLSTKIAFDHIVLRVFYDYVATFPSTQLLERAWIELISFVFRYFLSCRFCDRVNCFCTHATITFKVNARTLLLLLLYYWVYGFRRIPNQFRSHKVQLLASDTTDDEFDFYKMIFTTAIVIISHSVRVPSINTIKHFKWTPFNRERNLRTNFAFVLFLFFPNVYILVVCFWRRKSTENFPFSRFSFPFHFRALTRNAQTHAHTYMPMHLPTRSVFASNQCDGFHFVGFSFTHFVEQILSIDRFTRDLSELSSNTHPLHNTKSKRKMNRNMLLMLCHSTMW